MNHKLFLISLIAFGTTLPEGSLFDRMKQEAHAKFNDIKNHVHTRMLRKIKPTGIIPSTAELAADLDNVGKTETSEEKNLSTADLLQTVGLHLKLKAQTVCNQTICEKVLPTLNAIQHTTLHQAATKLHDRAVLAGYALKWEIGSAMFTARNRINSFSTCQVQPLFNMLDAFTGYKANKAMFTQALQNMLTSNNPDAAYDRINTKSSWENALLYKRCEQYRQIANGENISLWTALLVDSFFNRENALRSAKQEIAEKMLQNIPSQELCDISSHTGGSGLHKVVAQLQGEQKMFQTLDIDPATAAAAEFKDEEQNHPWNQNIGLFSSHKNAFNKVLSHKLSVIQKHSRTDW